MTNKLQIELLATKDDKWILASHIQKAVRRGLPDEAAWAAGHLHDVDRAYLAYRLSVIAVEDTAAGDPEGTAKLVGDTPWGAKKFGSEKGEAERSLGQQVARDLANLRQDRTPCEWIACVRWLEDFEKMEGSWESLDPISCIERAHDKTLPWWQRGLLAWRAAGTDRFPREGLPKVEGAWEDWAAACDDINGQTIMMGLGAKQREAHPIFLPLAISDRLQDTSARTVDFKNDNHKHDFWLSAAIDVHTQPGIAAIHAFINQLSVEEKQHMYSFKDKPANIIGKLMFMMEGGHIDKGWAYTTQQKIAKDIRERWLQTINGGNGQWLAQHLMKPEEWKKHKELIISKSNLGYHQRTPPVTPKIK